MARHWRGTMMAAVGAPEVITQLESAAKVLMVRHSLPVCGPERDGERILTQSWVELGGWGLRRGSFWSRLLFNVFSFYRRMWAMRGAAPGLSPSRREKKIIRSFSKHFSRCSLSFLSQGTITLKYFSVFGRFPMWLSFPETSAVRVGALSAVTSSFFCTLSISVRSISLLLAYPVLPPTLARIKCLTLCPPLVTAPVATN